MRSLIKVSCFFRQSKNYNPKGFTYVELLVSMAIIMVITSIILFSYPETVTRLTLANLSRSVALMLREAQIKGSATESDSGTIGGYGVYFDNTTPNKVILFSDKIEVGKENKYGIQVGDSNYDADENRSITLFPNGYSISNLCVLGSSGSYDCDMSEPLTVVFVRPDPQPIIFRQDQGTNYSAACVEMRAINSIRSVIILNSGLITTASTTCNHL